jgi:hypothetical protein
MEINKCLYFQNWQTIINGGEELIRQEFERTERVERDRIKKEKFINIQITILKPSKIFYYKPYSFFDNILRLNSSPHASDVLNTLKPTVRFHEEGLYHKGAIMYEDEYESYYSQPYKTMMREKDSNHCTMSYLQQRFGSDASDPNAWVSQEEERLEVQKNVSEEGERFEEEVSSGQKNVSEEEAKEWRDLIFEEIVNRVRLHGPTQKLVTCESLA